MYHPLKNRKFSLISSALLVSANFCFAISAQAETGITDKEIIIGSTVPLSGPNAGYGTIGKAQRACFDYVNAELGGVRWAMARPEKSSMSCMTTPWSLLVTCKTHDV